MRGALITTNLVTNIIECDENYLPPEGMELVILEDGTICNIGWSWDGEELSPPADNRVLATSKISRCMQVDDKTNEIRNNGFTYSGKQFSLSLAAQSKMMGAMMVKDYLTYPVRWNCINDEDAIDLADSTAVATFFMTALNTLRSVLDSGTTIKDSIRATSNLAELDAVVDDRPV